MTNNFTFANGLKEIVECQKCYFIMVLYIPENVIGLSNSPLEEPFQKALYGTQLMHDITEKYHHVDQEEPLISSLMDMLSDKTKLVFLVYVVTCYILSLF